MVIPLRLSRGAYAMYLQLKDQADLGKIKRALYTAFGTDSFLAWKQLIGRHLYPSETVDVYLAELRKLLVPFGGVNDQIVGCAFLAGLFDDVNWLLLASSRLGQLGIEQLLAKYL